MNYSESALKWPAEHAIKHLSIRCVWFRLPAGKVNAPENSPSPSPALIPFYLSNCTIRLFGCSFMLLSVRVERERRRMWPSSTDAASVAFGRFSHHLGESWSISAVWETTSGGLWKETCLWFRLGASVDDVLIWFVRVVSNDASSCWRKEEEKIYKPIHLDVSLASVVINHLDCCGRWTTERGRAAPAKAGDVLALGRQQRLQRRWPAWRQRLRRPLASLATRHPRPLIVRPFGRLHPIPRRVCQRNGHGRCPPGTPTHHHFDYYWYLLSLSSEFITMIIFLTIYFPVIIAIIAVIGVITVYQLQSRAIVRRIQVNGAFRWLTCRQLAQLVTVPALSIAIFAVGFIYRTRGRSLMPKRSWWWQFFVRVFAIA